MKEAIDGEALEFAEYDGELGGEVVGEVAKGGGEVTVDIPGRSLMVMPRRSIAEAAREAAAATTLLLLCSGFGMVMKTWRF